MQKYLVSINDLPPDGQEFTLDDQQIWLEPLREFKMDCRIISPLKSVIRVMPAENGCLARGTLEGAVIVPCNRCAEDAHVDIQSKFDEFEEIPEDEKAPHKDVDSEVHVIFEHHAPMLNLADVAWEQFMLALPSNPLCTPDCKGLCPKCGANLNLGVCQCAVDEGDDRMALLRNVKITKH